MSDYVPPEIVYEILLRLPVKSLCRFTLVSKSWFSLITTKSFISSHLHHHTTTTTTTTTDKDNYLLLRRYTIEDKQEHYTLHNQPDPKTDPSQFVYSFGLPPTEFDLPIKTQVGYFRIVASCDGLICLFDDHFRDIPVIVLWNPSIRKYVTLPVPSVRPANPHMVVLGFGRDMSSDDYKVVRIVYRVKNQLVGFEISPDVEVYSLEKRVWRRIMGAGILCNMMQFMWSHAYVNGSSYWIAWKNDGRTNLVLSFDMSSEIFKEILLPEILSRELASELVVSAYRESLAVLEYHKEPFAAFCNVWLMKKYGVSESWTNLYSIHLVSGVNRAVGFTKNDEILMKKTDEVLMLKADEQLVLYDPGTRLVMNLGVYGTAGSFRADKYVESLVLLEARDGISVEGSNQLVAG